MSTPARTLGKKLHGELSRLLANGDCPLDAPLDARMFQDALAYWEREPVFLDRNGCVAAKRDCPAVRAHCVGRCHLDYWIEHQEMAGEAMRSVAMRFDDADRAELYFQIGRLHDIDYLRYPHDAARPSDARHPAPLVGYLASRSFSIPGCIAILEHAPYLSLGRHEHPLTRRLSFALSLCEDAVTLRASDIYEHERELLPDEVVRILESIKKPAFAVAVKRDKGRYGDLPQRIVENFRALSSLF
jgi:predicted hydrolase (HD superfamily)